MQILPRQSTARGKGMLRSRSQWEVKALQRAESGPGGDGLVGSVSLPAQLQTTFYHPLSNGKQSN